MAPIDLLSGWKSAGSQIDAIKAYNESTRGEAELKKSAGNSASKGIPNLATQLNKISESQKRYQREAPTSMDQLTNLFGKVSGQGPESFRYLRKKFLEAAVKIGPEIKNILTEQTLSALGCSQQQTYNAVPKSQLDQITSLNQLPVQQGIYIPVSNLDLFTLLKTEPTTSVGKALYEKDQPSASVKYRPFGGKTPFPMNKELYQRMDSSNANRSFKGQFGKYYIGSSGQDLFDFQYTTSNEFGVTGDYYRVVLIDREKNGLTGGTLNTVGKFLQDYYETIKLVDSADIGAQLVNIISGAINIKAQLGASEITEQSKFYVIAQRILGLCFDDRREIDVSGIAKIAELDGVDDTFFEPTEIDLRNIDLRVSNVQQGVMEFEDCDNVKLPVDSNTLVNILGNFKDQQDSQSPEQQVESLEKIIDTISQNPDWKIFIPTNFNGAVSINKNVLKQIPLAVAANVLSPKVLLPIFTMLSVVQTSAKNTYNQAITSANTIISSGNTTGGAVNNVINNGVDFLRKFSKFCIQVISKIGGIFLKALFEIIKKDIINLLGIVIGDIARSRLNKRYTQIARLAQFLIIIAQIIQDYRKCKSLIDDILSLLKLINGLPIKRQRIPSALLLFSEFLPGKDPNRMSINTIQFMQQLGIPTGVLPDGSPNLMVLYNKCIHKGADKEEAENGVSDIEVAIPGVGKIPIPNMPR